METLELEISSQVKKSFSLNTKRSKLVECHLLSSNIKERKLTQVYFMVFQCILWVSVMVLQVEKSHTIQKRQQLENITNYTLSLRSGPRKKYEINQAVHFAYFYLPSFLLSSSIFQGPISAPRFFQQLAYFKKLHKR